MVWVISYNLSIVHEIKITLILISEASIEYNYVFMNVHIHICIHHTSKLCIVILLNYYLYSSELQNNYRHGGGAAFSPLLYKSLTLDQNTLKKITLF